METKQRYLKNSGARIRELLQEGYTKQEVSRMLGLSINRVYQAANYRYYVRKREKAKPPQEGVPPEPEVPMPKPCEVEEEEEPSGRKVLFFRGCPEKGYRVFVTKPPWHRDDDPYSWAEHLEEVGSLGKEVFETKVPFPGTGSVL